MANYNTPISGNDPLLPKPFKLCGLTANEWVHIVAMARRDVPLAFDRDRYALYDVYHDQWSSWCCRFLNGPVMRYILENRPSYSNKNKILLVDQLFDILDKICLELEGHASPYEFPNYSQPAPPILRNKGGGRVTENARPKDASPMNNRHFRDKDFVRFESPDDWTTDDDPSPKRCQKFTKRPVSGANSHNNRAQTPKQEPDIAQAMESTGGLRKHIKPGVGTGTYCNAGCLPNQSPVALPMSQSQSKGGPILQSLNQQEASLAPAIPAIASVGTAAAPTAAEAGLGQRARPTFTISTSLVNPDRKVREVYHYQHHDAMPSLQVFLAKVRDQHQPPQTNLPQRIEVRYGRRSVNIDDIEHHGIWDWEETMKMVKRAGGVAEVRVTMVVR